MIAYRIKTKTRTIFTSSKWKAENAQRLYGKGAVTRVLIPKGKAQFLRWLNALVKTK